MSDLIHEKLKKIVNLQNIIKTDELHYKSKREKDYNFSEYSLLITFLRDIHEGYSSLEDGDEERSNFATKLKNLDKGKKNN